MSDSRVRYPCAIAPTINTTKLVATAIATFVSTDKFIILPSIIAATLCDRPFLRFSLFVIASNFSVLRDGQDEELEVRREIYGVRSKKKT
jgi:hypothetical protein